MYEMNAARTEASPKEPDSSHIDETPPSHCFPIAESGESTVKRYQKMIHYKSPIPKTRLTRALLTDNVCDERKLQVHLSKLLQDKRKESAKLRHKISSFAHLQETKRRGWNKMDEQQLNKLNLPQISSGNQMLESASLTEIYKKPQNTAMESFTVPLLPVMVGEDEQKIVEYDKQIFITRLPNIARLTTRQRKRYNGYKGSHLLEGQKAIQDRRFQQLSNSLSERKSASPPKKAPFFITKRSLTYL
ncbi:uncharacterized protein [Watersipora subatra]|uniref:uncharacterized protein n=1 Tax=Watersipora subatra TaxID=2589382 RepID=UPI00355ADB72